jgi:flavin-dependent dehydrogenase
VNTAAQRRSQLPAIAIGGGLAGAAFALELARNGHPVIVLERAHGPHHTFCGEFISEETQVLLRHFGIDVHALGASRVSHYRLVKGESQATTPLPFAAAGLSRFRLDAAMLAAAERAGAEVVRGAAVVGISPAAGALSVRTENRTWAASSVALATGKQPLRGYARPPSPIVGFKLHLESSVAVRELAKLVQLAFFRGGNAGACLIEDNVLCLAWVASEQLVRSIGSSWKAQREHLARQSSLLGDMLAGAHGLFGKPIGVASIPYGYMREQEIDPALYPVGDQLAVVSSYTGAGMAIALYSGILAARAVLAGCSAATYQSDIIRRLRPQIRLAGAIGGLLHTPAICGILIAGTRMMPGVAARLAVATRLRKFADITTTLSKR